MKLLLIDTTTKHCHVALVTENDYIDGSVYNCNIKHSEMLCLAVEQLLEKTNTTFADLDGYAVAIGVGSFTGIRIGVATVLGYARAVQKPIVSVPNLMMLSMGSGNSSVIYDAGNGYYYQQFNGTKQLIDAELIDYNDERANNCYKYTVEENYLPWLVNTARQLYVEGSYSSSATPLYVRKSQAEILCCK